MNEKHFTCSVCAETTRERLLRGTLSGGPGLDGYAYQADTYCLPCGQAIIRELIESFPACSLTEQSELPQDSNDFPMPIFFGESDSPQYCSNCGQYLYGPENDDEKE